jgi:hypothetical protein
MGRVKFLSATDKEALERSSSARASKASSRRSSRACARARARSRREAEGSPDGGQSLGPRRQGSATRRASISGASCEFLDDRQKRTGWLLIVVSAVYLVWFLKVRLFPPACRSSARNGFISR